MENEINKPTTNEILGKIASLSLADNLPETFMEVHDIVWEAFALGQLYILTLQQQLKE